MTTQIEKQETKKATGKAEQPPMESAPETLRKPADTLDESRAQAKIAYATYLKAQRKVATAYKEREQQEQTAYKETEQIANKDCDKAIEHAWRVREETEREAEKAYRKAIEKATQVYQESVAQALSVCRQTIEQGWQASRETSEQIWEIFQRASG